MRPTVALNIGAFGFQEEPSLQFQEKTVHLEKISAFQCRAWFICFLFHFRLSAH